MKNNNKIRANFSLSKTDGINLRKYNITLKNYKSKISAILDFILSLDELRVSSKEIKRINFDITFSNNEEIKEINKTYRNKDQATDVITFSLFSDDKNSQIIRGCAYLGDIIVSVERADEQKKTTLEDEILTLITHGVLHLFGFDHQTKEDYDFVVGIQDKVLSYIRRVS